MVLPRFITDELSTLLAGKGADDLVFIWVRGGTLRSADFRIKVWLPAVRSGDLPDGLRICDLRHTAASLMVSANASLEAVQLALGYASAMITLDRYAHLYTDDLEALADRMERYSIQRNGPGTAQRVGRTRESRRLIDQRCQ